MNTLKDYIKAMRLDEVRVLNVLQEHAVISDMCVTAEDVGDAGKAVAWLELNKDKINAV
jgi:hypothetical protein